MPDWKIQDNVDVNDIVNSGRVHTVNQHIGIKRRDLMQHIPHIMPFKMQ